MVLDDVDTPAALVDLDRLERNLQRAALYAAEHDLALRPHVKTHKSLFVAAAQLRHGARGLTCATPHETQVMSMICDDLFNAFPPVGAGRARRLMSLNSRTHLTVALDSVEALDLLQAAAANSGRRVGVYIELDVGMRRVGVRDPGRAVELAKCLASHRSLDFAGVALYPGHIRSRAAEQDSALDELRTDLSIALDALDRS